jgi:hypothetical protein
MSKNVIIANSEDGKDCVCYLTGKQFKSSKGVSFLLNGRIIDPDIAIKDYEIEAEKGFIVPNGINNRIGVAEYLQAVGISRNHRSYPKMLFNLADGLPLGENKYSKPEHS